MRDDLGYLIVPGVLADRESERLQAAVESMPRGRAGARNVLADARIREVAEHPRLIELATRVLGEAAIPFKATLFDKSARSNWLVAWHQDLALPIRRRLDVAGWGPWTRKGGRLHAIAPGEVLTRVVALRVHVDDSTSDNGPLRVLPGTHRLGRLTETHIATLAHEVAQQECLVGAGGVVAMRPLLVHASSKSTNGLPRRVIHIEYGAELNLGSGIELAVG